MCFCCRHLVKAGLLLPVTGETWSLSIPTLHTFIKTFSIGRKALLTVINKCKYYEITEQVWRSFIHIYMSTSERSLP